MLTTLTANELPSMNAAQVPGRNRMLVIEDDEDLSTAVIRIARGVNSDLDVDWVASAGGAQDLLSTNRYGLVLADEFLDGGERGSKLVRASAAEFPETMFAMMSALKLADFVSLAERELPRDVQILPKPFSAIELRTFLNGLLGEINQRS